MLPAVPLILSHLPGFSPLKPNNPIHPTTHSFIHPFNCLFFSQPITHRQPARHNATCTALSPLLNETVMAARAICYLVYYCFVCFLSGVLSISVCQWSCHCVCLTVCPFVTFILFSAPLFLSLCLLLFSFPRIHAADTTWGNTYLLDSFDQRGFQCLLFTLCMDTLATHGPALEPCTLVTLWWETLPIKLFQDVQ